MLKIIGVVLLALIAGFIGGAIDASMPHGSIRAREFIVVDASGTPRATLTVLPDQSTAPHGCQFCDGDAHLIILDQRNPMASQMWPPPRGRIDPAKLIELLKLLKLAGPLL